MITLVSRWTLTPMAFPISRDPPEGGTLVHLPRTRPMADCRFPISRDPPEGGTLG